MTSEMEKPLDVGSSAPPTLEISEKAPEREPWEDDRVAASVTSTQLICYLWLTRNSFLCVLGGALICACSIGFHATYGIWLTDYEKKWPDASFSTLSLIGNLMVATCEIAIFFAGLSMDAYGSKSCMCIGGILTVLGFVVLAQATEIWHAMLAQGNFISTR